jgi:methylmalonyl-CoA/ethylmalonyl-CoA epimerase
MGSSLSLNAHHVGMIVPDLEAALKAYASNFGVNFSVFELDESNSAFSGSSASFKLRIAFGLIDLSAVELIQPVAGETIHAKFLRQNGPGIHHLGFWVDDLNAARRQFDNRGYHLLTEGEIRHLGAFAYYESAEMHCIVEPLELSLELPTFLAEHANVIRGKE